MKSIRIAPDAKILIIRLSAMGDIILTTPVIRALREAYPKVEIHFLTKLKFAEAIEHNPHIDKLLTLKDKLKETIKELKSENYDLIVDLHKNLRSHLIKWQLGVFATTFPKDNFAKWQMTRFKRPTVVRHIVDRYAEAIKPLGLSLDNQGLDFFLPQDLQPWASTEIQQHLSLTGKPIAVVIGATHFTKRWPKELVAQYISLQPERYFVLLGGPSEIDDAEWIESQVPNHQLFNAVGRYRLGESAALMRECGFVVTNDTGLMHIAAAFRQPIVSIWGNTVPGFGMTPYQTAYEVAEVSGLSCRPCSRIGYTHCPKGHFKCMQGIDPQRIIELSRRFE